MAKARRDGAREVQAVRVIQCVARISGIPPDRMMGRVRTAPVVEARHKAIYLIRKWTGMTYPDLGRLFNRDHTTVISAYENMRMRMVMDLEFGREMVRMEENIKRRLGEVA